MTDEGGLARLGREVKSRRIQLGILSQKEAAELAGISLNTWCRVETGHGSRPDTLVAIARALKWPPSRPTELIYNLVAPDGEFSTETERSASVAMPAVTLSVNIPEETRRIFMALGWTPPPNERSTL